MRIAVDAVGERIVATLRFAHPAQLAAHVVA
jgi:hypothetical protein